MGKIFTENSYPLINKFNNVTDGLYRSIFRHRGQLDTRYLPASVTQNANAPVASGIQRSGFYGGFPGRVGGRLIYFEALSKGI